MFKTIKTLTVVSALAALLSACGVVNSLIPDQEIGNPLGLDGKTVTMTRTSSTGLSTQAGVTYTDATLSASFADPDLGSLPGGIKPNELVVALAIGPTVEMTGSATATFPDSVTFSNASLDLTVDDASGDAAFEDTFDATGLNLVLTKSSCTADNTAGTQSCSYSTSTSGNASVLLMDIASADFNTLWKLMTNDASPNTVSGSFSLTTSAEIPATSVTVTLQLPNGTLKF